MLILGKQKNHLNPFSTCFLTRQVLCCFCILTLAFCNKKAFSQNNILATKITLTISNQPIGAILEGIERKYNVHFIYNSGLIDKTKTISLQITNKSLLFTLHQIINNKNISIVGINNQIIFKLKKDTNQNDKTNTTTQTIYNQVTIYDTVKTTFTDTIHNLIIDTQKICIYDTIIVKQPTNQPDNKTNEKQRKAKTLSIGAWISPQIGFEQVQIPNAETALLDSIKKSTSNIVMGGSTAIYASLNLGNFQIGSGFMSRLMSSEINYNLHITNETSSSITINYTYNYWKYFIATKQIIMPSGDTIIASYKDSIQQQQIIPTQTIQRSAKSESIIAKQWNTTWYIGLPLKINYRFNVSRKISIPLQLLFETLIAIKTNTILLQSLNNEGLQRITTSELSYPTLFVTISTGISWQLNNHNRLLIMPLLATQINNYFNTTTRKSRTAFTGIIMGYEFTFLK